MTQPRTVSGKTLLLSPPLKWAGGKRWLVPLLAEIWLAHQRKRLVEPFVGGLAIALGLRPAKAQLNDHNVHLINFYRWLKRGLRHRVTMRNTEENYYRNRERFNACVRQGKGNSAEAAALFYYLNRTCYNGLCRFNRRGEFNVPFGRYKTIGYLRDFTPYRFVLRNWVFTAGDFSRMETKADDFIYADPPYDVEFTSYTPGGFGWPDQVRLAEWLASRKGPVVASNQATTRILRLYRQLGFRVRLVDAPRRIACKVSSRGTAREMLAFKNL